MDEDAAKQQELLLRAIVALLVDERKRSGADGLVEFVLDDAGLEYREIARLVGKKPDAVRMAIARRKETSA